jgi:hypothetical protein
VSVAQDAERRQLRAYIGIYPVAKKQGLSVAMQDGNIVLVQNAKNYGQTPAYDVFTDSSVVYVWKFSETTIVFDHPSSANMMVVPLDEYQVVAAMFNVPDDILRRWSRGEGWMKVSGVVHYKDVFGLDHETPFCAQYLFGESRPDATVYVCDAPSKPS